MLIGSGDIVKHALHNVIAEWISEEEDCRIFRDWVSRRVGTDDLNSWAASGQYSCGRHVLGRDPAEIRRIPDSDSPQKGHCHGLQHDLPLAASDIHKSETLRL